MREIKFRAWNKLSKVMRYGSVLELAVTFDNPDFEVTQYTGLKDRNKKEIYEGDLGGDRWWTWEVLWDAKGGFKIRSLKGPYGDERPRREAYFTSNNLGDMAVSGNIYENSLIKSE